MPATPFAQLRRRLALAGGRVSSGLPEGVQGRSRDAEFAPARIVDPPLRHIAPGEPTAWRDDLAFLDGTQHVELVGRIGTDPVVGATVCAGVRLRNEGHPVGVVHEVKHLVIARRHVLDAIDIDYEQFDAVTIDDGKARHPLGDVDHARTLVDAVRGQCEVAAATRFRRTHPETWLIVDGALGNAEALAHDDRMLGVVKSHASLPFEHEELEIYLTLPAQHRTAVFAPQARRAEVYSWGLRLRDWQGEDLFHGLVRVEAAATQETLDRVDELSRALLAERAPLPNDPRADRLLYGIHDVERWLHAKVS